MTRLPTNRSVIYVTLSHPAILAPMRRVYATKLASGLMLATLSLHALGQGTQKQGARPIAAPIIRRQPPAPASVPAVRPGTPHLGQWMDSHRNLPVEQQQHALEAEPGFSKLQPQVQQRIKDRLVQLNTMLPEQRQRVIERTEAMERLSPPQRQQVRGAMQQLGALPEDRRRAVARTFRTLRDMPESQRQPYLNSPRVRSQFNDQERGTLDNLVNAAPYLPDQPPPPPPPR